MHEYYPNKEKASPRILDINLPMCSHICISENQKPRRIKNFLKRLNISVRINKKRDGSSIYTADAILAGSSCLIPQLSYITGAGLAETRQLAEAKAVSELVERLAFYDTPMFKEGPYLSYNTEKEIWYVPAMLWPSCKTVRVSAATLVHQELIGQKAASSLSSAGFCAHPDLASAENGAALELIEKHLVNSVLKSNCPYELHDEKELIFNSWHKNLINLHKLSFIQIGEWCLALCEAGYKNHSLISSAFKNGKEQALIAALDEAYLLLTSSDHYNTVGEGAHILPIPNEPSIESLSPYSIALIRRSHPIAALTDRHIVQAVYMPRDQ